MQLIILIKGSSCTNYQIFFSYVSGPKYCRNEKYNEINDDLNGGEEDDLYHEAPEDTYSSSEAPRGSRNLNMAGANGSYPVVIVEHGSGPDYVTILAGIPARFGLNISADVKVGISKNHQ